jgi:hypothetical protein
MVLADKRCHWVVAVIPKMWLAGRELRENNNLIFFLVFFTVEIKSIAGLALPLACLAKCYVDFIDARTNKIL